MQTEKVLILDFGSQYTQLIARRVREAKVFSEIKPCNTPASEVLKEQYRGVILSGGPGSIDQGAYPFDPEILKLDLPVLGVCYGMQLMNHLHGGQVRSLEKGEYGRQRVSLSAKSALFRAIPEDSTVWMSHKDSVDVLASCYQTLGRSRDGLVAAFQHKEKPHFGLQFHPEVQHSEFGEQMLQNFLDICKCEGSWSLKDYAKEMAEEIRKHVGDRKMVSFVSGGVDSSVATLLCAQVMPSDRLHVIFVDHGLMRKGEAEDVRSVLRKAGIANPIFVDASERFLGALKEVQEAEEKRRIIGNLFIEVLEEQTRALGLGEDDTLLCQGTLYTDLIESGKGCGDKAQVIKSHHNVNPPFVLKKREKGLIVEPNREIFKDEVRAVGEILGLPHEVVWRHPFPGPGLAVRIMGEVTPDRVELLQKADAIYLDQIRKAGLYDKIWQAFAVFVPIKTVGVMGDCRKEGGVIALRAITSTDGMTADVYPFDFSFLNVVSSRIVNEVDGVVRVTYDITSKPPATIEWE